MFKDNPNVVPGITFLREVSEKGGEMKLPDNALVIGGGDTAMDAAATLKVLGVKNVTCATRKELYDFRASKEELETARALQVTIVDGYAPVAVDGNLVTLKHRRINSELKIWADLIVLAVGQETAAGRLGISTSDNKTVFEGAHASENVFVAGDIVQGDKTVVTAVQKGKDAAEAIDKYLGGK